MPNKTHETAHDTWGGHVKPIDELLSEMMARNASDLHIKAGSPPVIRVDGELILLDEPPLTPEEERVRQRTVETLHLLTQLSKELKRLNVLLAATDALGALLAR